MLAGLALIAGTAWYGQGPETGRPLNLFTSLPIYWPEAPDIAAVLKGDQPSHWARRTIEEQRRLRPIDTLDEATLGKAHDLLMIQPRPLSPAENVALDGWVGKGGRLLLFADPVLTTGSSFALGDRRRPQDVVLLSPIFAHWGLRLEFDVGQPAGERTVEVEGAAVPVNLAGRFVAVAGGRADAACAIRADALVADCRVGGGRVIAVADAALFDQADPSDGRSRDASLRRLLARAF